MKRRRVEGRVHIDAERCKGCGLCLAACPKGHLRAVDQVDRRGIRIVRPLEAGRCSACGACYAVCPDVAITVYREPASATPGGKRLKPARRREDRAGRK